jgi:hypothetical protein
MKKATDEQLLESYGRLGSIWTVAEEFGMCGESVWERLKRLGIEDKDKWTESQLTILKEAYSGELSSPININVLAKLLGKPKSSISRKARVLGLTSRNRKRPEGFGKQCGDKIRAWLQTHPHPRGAYKTGKQIRICPRCGIFFETYSSKQKYCGSKCGRHRPQSQGDQGYSKSGKRSDLNDQYFRSRWEANYARYLNYLISNGSSIVKWEYEPETFEFKKIKKGTRFYTPDFRLSFQDGHVEYHEVKGWDYPKGRTARKRFVKYYPRLKLVLIEASFFKGIKSQGMNKLIPGWE